MWCNNLCDLRAVGPLVRDQPCTRADHWSGTNQQSAQRQLAARQAQKIPRIQKRSRRTQCWWCWRVPRLVRRTDINIGREVLPSETSKAPWSSYIASIKHLAVIDSVLPWECTCLNKFGSGETPTSWRLSHDTLETNLLQDMRCPHIQSQLCRATPAAASHNPFSPDHGHSMAQRNASISFTTPQSDYRVPSEATLSA